MKRKYVEITDLPSDPSGSLGTLRRILLRAYNHGRSSDTKMKLLIATLTYMLHVLKSPIPEVPKPDPIKTSYLEQLALDYKELQYQYNLVATELDVLKLEASKPKPKPRKRKKATK